MEKETNNADIMKTENAGSPSGTGKGELLAGAGVTTYGTAMFLGAGYLCPFCVIAAPALLSIGAYKSLKSRRVNKDKRPTS